MTRRNSLLIDLLICDVLKCDSQESERFKVNLPKDLIKDVIQVFDRYDYKMARGVFNNEIELRGLKVKLEQKVVNY